MKRRFLSLLFALVLLLSAVPVGFAYEVPDLEDGSLTLNILTGDDEINSGILRIYRVADIILEDGEYSFKLLSGLPKTENSLDDPTDPELAKELREIVRDRKKDLLSYEADIEDNTAYFPKVEAGLYLVVQIKAIKGYDFMAPFLISVPQNGADGDFDFTVVASPKVPIETNPTKPTKPSPTKPTDAKLPQTGQLNWPVPIMAVVGLALVLGGWLLIRSDKKERYEK